MPNVQYFLGGNTPLGFYSLYHQLSDPAKHQAVYILKGGAGCGKSSLMRRVGRHAQAAGLQVVEVPCSGDPDSLDAILLPQLGAAVVDGTAPHVVEPACAGVVERYVDLSRFYSWEELQPLKGDIITMGAACSACYKRVYRCLGAAGELLEDVHDRVTSDLLTQKLARRARGIIARELKPIAAASGEELQGFLTEFPQRDGKPARGGASTQSAALTASGGRNSAGTAAGVNPSGSAALQATPSVGAINPGSRTVNVSITADSASNNGLLEIQFDPGVLDFNATSGASHLTSIVDNGDGTLTFGYASLEEIPAGSSLCVLTFHYQGSSLMTDLTVTTLEANDTNPNTSAEVDIQYQGAVTPPVNPGTEDPGEPEPPEQSGSESYTDLNPNAWYRQYADYVIEQGLMKGTSSTTFSPNEPLTRAMLVTILYRLEDMPSVTAGDRFSDVADATWYTDAVRWAADIGIVEGYGNGRFGPANPITRQELAVILWRYARYKGYDVGAAGAVLPDFADRGEIASWAGEAISWAYSRGIIIGKLDNVLDPRGGTTRIEAATMVTRFLWMDQD